jgi:uncharacterized protein (DUF1778 family)
MSYSDDMAKPTRTPMKTERERTIGVRVSDAEYTTIERAASDVGLSVSAFVRMVALERSKTR